MTSNEKERMLSHLVKIFMPSQERQHAHAAYLGLVEKARHERFFTEGGVPDTLDGRFEMILLHLFLLLHRLKHAPETKPFRQQLMEAFMEDMDRSVRELGVSDTGVGKRVKKMAAAMYGRIAAYEMSLDDREALKVALRRNVYGTMEEVSDAALTLMIDYLMQEERRLQDVPQDRLLSGALE